MSDILNQVMTVQEIAEEFGISRLTIHDALRHGWIKGRQSGKTWLILRKDAKARWGKQK